VLGGEHPARAAAPDAPRPSSLAALAGCQVVATSSVTHAAADSSHVRFISQILDFDIESCHGVSMTRLPSGCFKRFRTPNSLRGRGPHRA